MDARDIAHDDKNNFTGPEWKVAPSLLTSRRDSEISEIMGKVHNDIEESRKQGTDEESLRLKESMARKQAEEKIRLQK